MRWDDFFDGLYGPPRSLAVRLGLVLWAVRFDVVKLEPERPVTPVKDIEPDAADACKIDRRCIDGAAEDGTAQCRDGDTHDGPICRRRERGPS